MELILLLIACFFIIIFFLLFVAIFVGAIISVFKPNKQKADYETTNYGKTDNPTAETKVGLEEETDGDGLVLLDDPMFPPSFDDEDD